MVQTKQGNKERDFQQNVSYIKHFSYFKNSSLNLLFSVYDIMQNLIWHKLLPSYVADRTVFFKHMHGILVRAHYSVYDYLEYILQLI